MDVQSSVSYPRDLKETILLRRPVIPIAVYKTCKVVVAKPICSVVAACCAHDRLQEESQLTDALQRRRLVNPHLKVLHAELSACDKEESLDAFGLFM